MQVISVEELVTKKILPFNLYNENGEKIFNAGEVLTPGKLLQLRYISVIYRDETEEPAPDPTESDKDPGYDEYFLSKPKEEENLEEYILQKPPVPKENQINYIPAKKQKQVKNSFEQALNLIKKEDNISDSIPLFLNTRDQIVEDVFSIVDDVIYRSQLKIHGDFDSVHGVNVSILSTLLANKLKLSETKIRDIALAALLHDIGETKIPRAVRDKIAPSAKELQLIELHPQIGYKIIKKEMGLSESIAKVALEHHERNDGSGYPYGISGDLISPETQIIIVADVYDTLMAGKSSTKVKNTKEALRHMLSLGSKWFAPEALYTFTHMSNFNDTTPAEITDIGGLL